MEEPQTPTEEIEVTAPTLPSEMILRQHVQYFQRTPNGGMTIKVCAAVPGPGGMVVPLSPAYIFGFDAAGWERFKKTVADDGVPPPVVETSTILPPGFMNGRPQG